MATRLSFFDVATYTKSKKNMSKERAKERATFNSQSYTIKTRMVKGHKKKYAVTKSPTSGNDVWRVLPKDFK